MPRLSELTDYNYDPMGIPTGLPVEKPFADLKKVYITGEQPSEKELPVQFGDEPTVPQEPSKVRAVINALFRNDEERLQLWPERMVRAGATAAGKVMSGEIPQWAIDPKSGDVHTSPQMTEAAQEMSALAGTGGLGGAGGTLNATPSLRPALKYQGKLYKGKPGQEHMDVIPESLYPTFQKQAMSGEDISNFNFGFINDKGHFLSREDALKYGIDNGLIDPHAGKYGALTSTLMADSSKPGVAIEAMKTANPFFSALEHNVSKISQSKMTGDQWLGTLANKPGVKPEELQWTGLSDFLAENKGKTVTKAQIEEHLAANKVELKEVNKGVLAPERQKLRDQGLSEVEIDKRIPFDAVKDNTKYSSYQLPGGENYREMLLTLPKSGRAKFEAQQNEILARREKIQDEFDGLYGKEDADTLARRKELTKKFNDTTDELQKLDLGAAERTNFGDYKSSHWNEPNILAHVRMNDRTIDGKKSLHLEEIQSDWHQQGRDKGYKSKLNEVEQKEYDKFIKIMDNERRLTPEEQAKFGELNLKKDHGVPDAPFKKTWHELALKRMIREAAEKGYDRLSWTPGETQAARYDLSKKLDTVRADPKPDGTFNLSGMKNKSLEFEQKNVSADKVADYVGKDLADKLLKSEKNKYGMHELTGVDLKIGGEGMKGFYDQIIPKALEKLGKEHGVKVKKGELFGKLSNKMGQSPEMHPVYYIDIPQSLKDTATQKGFPLFSKGGYMLQPVDHTPDFGTVELKT